MQPIAVPRQHDHHFLERLERLEREHAEIALGLYYDSRLVRHILHVAKVPDEAERVALCLSTAEVGPHVIVARDGHFVTCLAEGMSLREDQPVISRHTLDVISEDVESLRSLVADAKAGGSRQRLRKVERIFSAGPGLSQEEFEDIGRWLPLMAVDFLTYHTDAMLRCLDLVQRLGRVKKLKKRDDGLLHDYWRLSWAAAHLTMLLGIDGGKRMRDLFEVVETNIPGMSTQMAWGLVRTGVVPFAVRGAWLASKLPTLVVPEAKRRYLDERATFLTSLTDGLSLTAIGLRHRRYQGEVRKVLARRDPSLDAEIDHIEAVRAFCARSFEMLAEGVDPHVEHLVGLGREFMHLLYPDAKLDDPADEVPRDVAVAALMLLPVAIEHYSVDSLHELFVRLPWVVGVEARSFYLPEAYIGVARMPYTREAGLLLLEPRKRLGVHRPKPIIAAPKIGRNQPCPCGSGIKHKRCCNAPGK
jgi:hypothetical protein